MEDPHRAQAAERVRALNERFSKAVELELAGRRSVAGVEPEIPAWERVMRETHHPDVEFRPMRGFTDSGETHGIDTYVAWVHSYLSVWKEWRSEYLEVEQLDHQVLAHMLVEGRGQSSGVEIGGDLYALIDLRDGLILRIEHHGTREGALRAAARERQT